MVGFGVPASVASFLPPAATAWARSIAVSSSTMAVNGLPSGLAKVPSLNARPFMDAPSLYLRAEPIGILGRVPVGGRAYPGCRNRRVLIGERILPLRRAPVVHRLAERVGDDEQSAAALLQGAAEGFEQIDDSWEHGSIPFFSCSVTRGFDLEVFACERVGNKPGWRRPCENQRSGGSSARTAR